MNDRKYWIGFNLIRGIGSVRLQGLIAAFGDLKAAWEADASLLREAGLGRKTAERVLQARERIDLDHVTASIEAAGIRVLTWQDAAYPARLKEIEQPPPVLYLRGDLREEDQFAVALVGTRRVTAYGRQIAEQIAAFLAGRGITVISGLARGVDAVAHQSALAAGGRTLAVLGCGVDQVYPPEHRELAERIVHHGALVSDYAPGTAPDAANFPPRNRIISGLAQAVVVVEAGETSGALITAEFAAEQGRDVFAVPGSILAPQSKGTNRLIQNGALPLLGAEDLVQALDLGRVGEYRSARKSLPQDEIEAGLLALLGDEPLHVDEIRSRAGLPVEKISATLVLMELKGMVRQVGGMNYVAVREDAAGYEVMTN